MVIAATFVDTKTFTVVGDQTNAFHTGRRVQCNCGDDGFKYGTILSSSYSDPSTTVILTTASDDLTENLSAVKYGIVGTGVTRSIPEHDHSGEEGSGGEVGAGGPHKDTHDPEDGFDALDCGAPGEIVGVAAAAEGSAHSFARSDHNHQVQHGISDNHILTVDHETGVVAGDYAKFTAKGLEGRDKTEMLSDLSGGTLVVGDHGAAAIDELINVCYGTGDPPAPETTTEGALFVKYTE